MNETLRRILESRESKFRRSDYVELLTQFTASDEQSLHSVNIDPKFEQHLKNCGLKRGQRAGVANILGSTGFLTTEEPGQPGKRIVYQTTVGDVRELTDENLGKITSERGINVLRKLFGRKDIETREPNKEDLPPFIKERYK